MNRSLGYIGLAVILIGIGLASFPIVATGREVFDLEQEAGCLVAPVGLVVVMLAAAAYDPRRTTVTGAFGNTDEPAPRAAGERVPLAAPRRYNPHEPAACHFCRTFIDATLAQCPRCARARACRTCGRPLGLVLERATCPR